MNSLRREFETNYAEAERILLRNQHHGLFLDMRRRHREQLDA